ncbi:hypothetical protein FOZ63_020848 [Perkinsus olseni]|uniref:Uncharacterized protein n=1 Tax=Perkinsus olseni TaxID=32597 RepID=A0A7J6SSN3_PEROL|nr:hypothetical protein FOZ60_016544 [Perkinsus olseni]KAF4735176.1 hypothetical protein FOZ62_015430 [Perkinsus olseni]KAF4740851.1 hypothetical protein FOZ63_020848 [Perkinsus olseni]
MNFLQASLVAAQTFVFVASQYAGLFLGTLGATKVYMDVYESKSVVVLIVSQLGKGSYASGRIPLTGDGHIYSLDFGDGTLLEELRGNLTQRYSISVEDEDLSTITFYDVNDVSTPLQGEIFELSRLSFPLQPEAFCYTADDESVMLRFEIESAEELKAGVLCSGKTFFSTLKLSRQETASGSAYYEIQSTRRDSVEDLRRWVLANCSRPVNGVYDLSRLTSATPTVIYSQFGGVPIELRKRTLL